MTHRFTAPLQRISAKGGSHLAVVPQDVADELRGGERRGRVVVTLASPDGAESVTWHAGLNPYGGGKFYVQVGRNYHEPLGYAVGDELPLALRRDTSTYGMQPCEEFVAVAESDPEGERLLRECFTAGTQRTLLHRIAAGRTSDARIERAVRVFDQLHLGVRDRATLLAVLRKRPAGDAELGGLDVPEDFA